MKEPDTDQRTSEQNEVDRNTQHIGTVVGRSCKTRGKSDDGGDERRCRDCASTLDEGQRAVRRYWAGPLDAVVDVHISRCTKKAAWRPDLRVNLSERDAYARTPAADSSRLGACVMAVYCAAPPRAARAHDRHNDDCISELVSVAEQGSREKRPPRRVTGASDVVQCRAPAQSSTSVTQSCRSMP